MKPFLADPSYAMQYFRTEVEKNKKQATTTKAPPPHQKKNPKCQIQILRYETNWNGNSYCYIY